MTAISKKSEIEKFKGLSSLLEECINSNKIITALDIAAERHKSLVNAIENDTLRSENKNDLIKEAMLVLSREKILARAKASVTRGNFIARKTAYQAYSSHEA